MKISRVFAVVLLFVALVVAPQSRACAGWPTPMVPTIDALVASSETIALAKLASVREAGQGKSDLMFAVVEQLKGSPEPRLSFQAQVTLSTTSESSESIAPYANAPTGGAFWLHDKTPGTLEADCSVSYRRLSIQQTYVVMVGGDLGKYSILPVSGPEDSWYKAVVAALGGASAAEIADLLTTGELFDRFGVLQCTGLSSKNDRVRLILAESGFRLDQLENRHRICGSAGAYFVVGYNDEVSAGGVKVPISDGRLAIEKVSAVLGGLPN